MSPDIAPPAHVGDRGDLSGFEPPLACRLAGLHSGGNHFWSRVAGGSDAETGPAAGAGPAAGTGHPTGPGNRPGGVVKPARSAHAGRPLPGSAALARAAAAARRVEVTSLRTETPRC